MSAEDSGRSCAYRVRHALLLVQEHCSFIDRSHHLRSVGPSKDVTEAPVFDLCLVLLSRVSHFREMHPGRECGKVANTLICSYTTYSIYVIWCSPIMLSRGRRGKDRLRRGSGPSRSWHATRHRTWKLASLKLCTAGKKVAISLANSNSTSLILNNHSAAATHLTPPPPRPTC